MDASWDPVESSVDVFRSSRLDDTSYLKAVRLLGLALRRELCQKRIPCRDVESVGGSWLESILLNVDQFRRSDVSSFRDWCRCLDEYGLDTIQEVVDGAEKPRNSDFIFPFDETVCSAICHLGEHERKIVVLRTVGKLDFQEIASRLQISPEVATRSFDTGKKILVSVLESSDSGDALSETEEVSETFAMAMAIAIGCLTREDREIIRRFMHNDDSTGDSHPPSPREMMAFGRFRDTVELDDDICREIDQRRAARTRRIEKVFSRVVEVLRMDDAAQSLETFFRQCEQVGMRALRRRKNIDRLRAAVKRVPFQPTLAGYAEELANAAGVVEPDAIAALGLPPGESWEALNQPTSQTKQAVEWLKLDKRYVRQALRVPCLDAALATASRRSVSEVKDLDWICREIQRHIDEAHRSGNASVVAKIRKRDEEIAALFADDVEA